jgi:predicted nucleotidyltransferase
MRDIAVKDFIETAEELVFAVVMSTLEQGKVLCFLRYVTEDHLWKKLSTQQANTFLKQHYPQYLYYSPVLDAHLHAVPLEHIAVHHQPKQRLQQLLQSKHNDVIEADAVQLCDFLQANAVNMAQLGITGSLLIGAQHAESDIDLVCYQKQTFQQCRQVIKLLIEHGRLQDLSAADWQEAYSRRDCALSFADYVWHEQRKYNKAMINGRKFDLSFVSDHAPSNTEIYQKCGAITLQCKITDDSGAFDYPAEFAVDADQIGTLVSFTATYTGQAMCGETIEVSGILEQDQHGVKRVVVGSSREAHGEYIRVIHG